MPRISYFGISLDIRIFNITDGGTTSMRKTLAVMQQDKKYNTFISLLRQFCLSVSFGFLIYIIIYVIDHSDGPGGIIPAGVIFVGIPLTILFGILFYILTTFHNIIWTVINIILNIYIIRIQYDFVDSTKDLEGLSSVLFFTTFWVINKVLISKFLDNFNPKRKPINKLDHLIYKARTANSA